MRAMLKLCAVFPPDASEQTDQHEGDENEVNTGEIIVSNVPGCLEIISSLNHHHALVVRHRRAEKKLKDISHFE
ncbi:hypothetical protein TNCV_2291611 [Trichonephila clavipes]|uniref:Uncharacterized protein n=1 Tax=Trichonephila clavipes TaxID=2585209 RepID=A0A8X6V6H5_TRICX|nr:hypothetical protein TNCV_2291611 [Trichonephila clavipes]